MALINQISTIVNDAVDDALGGSSTLAAARETSDFVTMGVAISEANLYENFFGSLLNRLVKTVIASRAYSADSRGILRDETEWGAFKQKVHFSNVEAVDNPAFGIPQISENVRTYNQTSPYDVEGTIGVTALIFGGQGTWSLEIIRPIAQIMTAFNGASEMAAFIDGIYVEIENSFQQQLESVENLAAATGIGLTIAKGRKINLLTEYNATVPEASALTVSNCLYSVDFLRYAAQRISETVRYMAKRTKLFNVGGLPKFTPKDKLVVEILEKFASQSAFYLQSDTFHKELVELPKYASIPFWQDAGDGTFAFSDLSTVSVQNDGLIVDPEDESDTGTVTQSGVIAFLHDIDYVAANFGERYTWEEMNKRDRIMIHGEQARKGYAVDPNEQSVVFYIENPASNADDEAAGDGV